MKKTLLSAAAMLSAAIAMSQTDTTTSAGTQKVDTIKIGSMTIIKRKGDNDYKKSNDKEINVQWNRKKNRNKNVHTSYVVLDFGLSNFSDKTNYASADARSYAVVKAGEAPFTSSDFNLRNIKSTNFNLWFFMQRRNLVKHVLNLKYGLGIETNNYRFENNVSFKKGSLPYVFRDSIGFTKNKLALDYITIPVMLNFNTNPKRDNALSMSVGVSAGYLYSSRNKQKSSERGKQKNRGDFDAETWKISMVGEIGIGPLKLYGSYAPKSMFERGLDMRPYNIGFRLGGWD